VPERAPDDLLASTPVAAAPAGYSHTSWGKPVYRQFINPTTAYAAPHGAGRRRDVPPRV
jgi:hypothetical protein